MSYASRLFIERLLREPVANRVEAFAVRDFSLVRSQVGREELVSRLEGIYFA